jgi:hypothetical protein
MADTETTVNFSLDHKTKALEFANTLANRTLPKPDSVDAAKAHAKLIFELQYIIINGIEHRP